MVRAPSICRSVTGLLARLPFLLSMYFLESEVQFRASISHYFTHEKNGHAACKVLAECLSYYLREICSNTGG